VLTKLKVDTKELVKLKQELESIIAEIPAAKRHDLDSKMATFQTRMRQRKEDYRNPAELMVAAALVNQNRWDPVVKSRLKLFRAKHRGVESITDLRNLLARMSDEAIYKRVLHFGNGKNPRNYRTPLLRGLVKGFCAYGSKMARGKKEPSDFEIMRTWARESDSRKALRDAAGGEIPGLGPKLVDWLRMFGGDFQTVPNDVYTMRGMKCLGLDDAGKTAEFLARLFRISPRTLDMIFQRARL
jgi:hypothetical protein